MRVAGVHLDLLKMLRFPQGVHLTAAPPTRRSLKAVLHEAQALAAGAGEAAE